MAGRVRGVTGHARVAIAHGWELAATPAGAIGDPSQLGAVAWRPAHVPGTAASALPDTRGARALDDLDWWWRAPLNPELTAGCVLGLDGVATLWDAWIDGERVAGGENMWEATEVALAQPARELVIRCRSLTAELAKKRPRPRWRVPMLEQQQLRWIRTTLLGRAPGWSGTQPAVGPWRPVWLEQRTHDVRDVRVRAALDGNVAIVNIDAAFAADAAEVVVARDGEHVTARLARAGDRWIGEARVPGAARWWPHTHGTPTRYHVAIHARDGARAFEINLGHTGFRTIEIDRGARGDDFRVVVNGEPIFCRGACWTPLDPLAIVAPSPDAYDAAIRQVVAGGMNMLRVGGTMAYEADAFHDALDARGVLLWQDLMCANMDYPDELAPALQRELDQLAARLEARPSLAVICGNSEGEQQAAMWGAPRERWSPALFHEPIAPSARPGIPDRLGALAPYVPSSATGGAFPHASNAGPSSYYGVGAYLRPLDDARRAEVKFASECLAFANLPSPGVLPAERRVHHAEWKAAGPRDLGAGWDFDDVRDHYVKLLFGVDPTALRWSDHERYLALGRVATGEVMAQTFGEWRRARSVTGGGLVWFLRDLQLGAGWGVLDAHGAPKPAWWILRRALQPVAVAITDEGTNGLALHVANDGAEPVAGTLELALWRDGTAEVGRASREVTVPARGALEVAAGALFDHFVDLSWAYKFGPPVAHAIRARFGAASAWYFPAGYSLPRAPSEPLAVALDGHALTVRAARVAQYVAIDVPGWLADDNYFHLAPGDAHSVLLSPAPDIAPRRSRGTVTSLDSDASARVEIIP